LITTRLDFTMSSVFSIRAYEGCIPLTQRPVYLDHHATTPTDPRVLEAMLPYFTNRFGNPASNAHSFGWEAAEAVEEARGRVAGLLGAEPREVVFTSGATESNNLAIKGVLPGLRARGNHVVASAIEHPSVLAPLKRLAREGWDLSLVPPDAQGLVSADSVANALTDRTVLVSVMAANHEVGTINPLAEIGHLCRMRGLVFHTDATQAVGKTPFDANEVAADLISVSGHKFYGPKGIGALVVRRAGQPLRMSPLLEGGGHERGLRSGSVAVPLVVGLSVAAEIAARERDEEAARLLVLRERLHQGLGDRIEGLRLNGHPTRRLPGNLNVSIPGVDGEALMMGLTEIAVSSGAACSSAHPEPSHVLLAMGLEETLARASLRFGLGRTTTAGEVDLAIEVVTRTVERLRARSPVGIDWTL
jgi:cysteine desulfurase